MHVDLQVFKTMFGWLQVIPQIYNVAIKHLNCFNLMIEILELFEVPHKIEDKIVCSDIFLKKTTF